MAQTQTTHEAAANETGAQPQTQYVLHPSMTCLPLLLSLSHSLATCLAAQRCLPSLLCQLALLLHFVCVCLSCQFCFDPLILSGCLAGIRIRIRSCSCYCFCSHCHCMQFARHRQPDKERQRERERGSYVIAMSSSSSYSHSHSHCLSVCLSVSLSLVPRSIIIVVFWLCLQAFDGPLTPH